MQMNFKILISLAIVLLGAFLIFHFKTALGALVLPIFCVLVGIVTVILFKLIVKDDKQD